MKHKLLLAILITNFILVSCNSNQPVSPINNNTSQQSNTSSSNTSQKSSAVNNEAGVTVKIIKVDPKCVGCGRCIGVDSANFRMNEPTHKSEPIQGSGHETDLQNAIDGCPAGAISVS